MVSRWHLGFRSFYGLFFCPNKTSSKINSGLEILCFELYGKGSAVGSPEAYYSLGHFMSKSEGRVEGERGGH